MSSRDLARFSFALEVHRGGARPRQTISLVCRFSPLRKRWTDREEKSMQTVLITPRGLIKGPGAWMALLEEAGFAGAYPEDPTFTRGLCGAAETMRVLRPAAAVIAGGEYCTAEVLAGLPQLRVIARAGVGFDRVDVPAATARKIAVTI